MVCGGVTGFGGLATTGGVAVSLSTAFVGVTEGGDVVLLINCCC